MKLFDKNKNNRPKKSKLISLDGSHVSEQKVKRTDSKAALGKKAGDGIGNMPSDAAANGKKRRLSKKAMRRLAIIFLVLVLLFSTAYGLVRMFVKPPSANIDIDENNIDNIASDPNQLEGLEPTVSSSKKRKEDYFTMIIACTDEGKTRTDAMILMSFDVKNKTVNLMNIPRDTMSNVTRSVKKINGAYAHGKLKQMYKELNMLLGIPIDRYVIFDFDGVAQMVEAIGGVKFDVPRNMNYDDPTQNLHIHLKKGEQTLNGENAVKMLRFRKNNNGSGYARGDIERIELMQSFVKALAQQMLTPSTLSKLPQLAKAVTDNTDTDLKNGEMIWFGIQALSMDFDSISTHTLPGYSKSVYESGIGMYQSYWIPRESEVLELINSSFNPYTTDITDLDIVGGDKVSNTKPTSSSKTTQKPTQTEEPSTTSKPHTSQTVAPTSEYEEPTVSSTENRNTVTTGDEPNTADTEPTEIDTSSEQEPTEPQPTDVEELTSSSELEQSPVI